MDDLTFLSQVIGGAKFQELPETLKTRALTALLKESENHGESATDQDRSKTSNESCQKSRKIEILASISHDIDTGETEVQPEWLNEYLRFPKKQEKDDQDLRGDTDAVPARDQSQDSGNQSPGSSLGSASVKSWRTAYMNTIRADVRSEPYRIPSSASGLIEYLRRHRIVDPIRDEGIGAIVDDGCNSCCHGSAWRKNAEEKWKAKGFKCILLSSEPRNFGGVGRGTIQSKGYYRLPFALRLVESYRRVPGVIGSHEKDDSEQPLLLSH